MTSPSPAPALRLIQFRSPKGERRLAASGSGQAARLVEGADTVLALAQAAIEEGNSLADSARSRLGEEANLGGEGVKLLPAIDHPDPAHLLLTGTGLTHLGSAAGRDQMHKAASGSGPTDSMRMFQMRLAGGKPEIAGVYLIDGDGTPRRLGFVLANEFTDHVVEKENYLWLAHSKLRATAIGAELLTGPLPPHVAGTSRIPRDGALLWEGEFVSGEDNMSHSIANLERHHFKYVQFRRPGDVHVHFFGTATLSFAAGIRTREGDEFEIRAEPFALPLRNRLVRSAAGTVVVRAL